MIGRETTSAGAPLYVHKATLACAFSESGCVACLYKLSPNGKFGDMSFPANIRPELCPRASDKRNKHFDAGIYWRADEVVAGLNAS